MVVEENVCLVVKLIGFEVGLVVVLAFFGLLDGAFSGFSCFCGSVVDNSFDLSLKPSKFFAKFSNSTSFGSGVVMTLVSSVVVPVTVIGE